MRRIRSHKYHNDHPEIQYKIEDFSKVVMPHFISTASWNEIADPTGGHCIDASVVFYGEQGILGAIKNIFDSSGPNKLNASTETEVYRLKYTANTNGKAQAKNVKQRFEKLYDIKPQFFEERDYSKVLLSEEDVNRILDFHEVCIIQERIEMIETVKNVPSDRLADGYDKLLQLLQDEIALPEPSHRK